MTAAAATPSQTRATTLKLGYRNPGHLLFSYCAHLCHGRLWVRSPNPLPEGTPVKLELVVPGQRWTELLHATVQKVREKATDHGPPGMGLVLEDHEPMLGELVDRMVPLSQPCRVDLVGANAYATRQLASMTQTFMECRIEHRELRDDVLFRCAGADVVVVDLQVNIEAGLQLLRALADEPNAPTLVVLFQDLTTPAAKEAASLAHIAQLPLEPYEYRRAILRALGQTCWLGAHRVANINDTMPTPAVSVPKQKPTRLRTAGPKTELPKLRPSAESNWSVHTSWSSPPARGKTRGALVSQEIYDASPTPPGAQISSSQTPPEGSLGAPTQAIPPGELGRAAANEGPIPKEGNGSPLVSPFEEDPTSATNLEDTLEPGHFPDDAESGNEDSAISSEAVEEASDWKNAHFHAQCQELAAPVDLASQSLIPDRWIPETVATRHQDERCDAELEAPQVDLLRSA